MYNVDPRGSVRERRAMGVCSSTNVLTSAVEPSVGVLEASAGSEVVTEAFASIVADNLDATLAAAPLAAATLAAAEGGPPLLLQSSGVGREGAAGGVSDGDTLGSVWEAMSSSFGGDVAGPFDETVGRVVVCCDSMCVCCCGFWL
jgi:hypothetical protein